MISSYISHQTWLHRISAGAKLFALAVATVLLLPLSRWPFLLLPLLAAVLLYATLGRPGLKRFVHLKGLLVMILAIGFFQMLMTSIDSALLTVIRILVMVMLADLVSITTTMQQMMRAITPLFRPLAFLGVSVQRLSLMVALVVRFVPLLLSLWNVQSEAWRARTGKSGGIRLIAPFARETLRLSDHVAESLAARSLSASVRTQP